MRKISFIQSILVAAAMTLVAGVHFAGSASAASVNIRQQGNPAVASEQHLQKVTPIHSATDICKSDADCSGSTPYCITSTASVGNGAINYSDNSRCVQCKNASQCTNTTAAAPFAHCTGNVCRYDKVCSSNAQCASVDPSKPYCVNNSCVACSTHSQCPTSAPFCIGNTCKNECSTSAQCSSVAPSLPYCTSTVSNTGLVKGKCVSCLSNVNCPSSAPFCKNSVCQSSCQYNTQCENVYGSARPKCISGTCKECSYDSECRTKNSSKPYCNNNVCEPYCESSSQCPAYYYCGRSSGGCGATCKPNCTTDNDCPNKKRCASTGCGTYCETVDCKVTSDCAPQTGKTVSCNNYSCHYTTIQLSTMKPGAANSIGNGVSFSGGCSTGGC